VVLRRSDKLVRNIEQYEVWTEERFMERIKAGEKLVILDEFILDISDYARKHPGGTYLLTENVGRDISKFFYGGYAFDGNSNNPKAYTPRWDHSNIARRIVSTLIVGVMKSKDLQTVVVTIDASRTSKVNEKTATFIFKSTKAESVFNWMNYYPDLGMIGKHFLISSRLNRRRIHRHYTIANCMRQDIYENLREEIKSQQDSLENGQMSHVNINPNILDASEQDNVAMTLKTYDIPNGLSTLIHNGKQQAIYHIKGPMGKGLGLSPSSKGVHVAFAAGTGVLVYIDIVARLILQLLQRIPEDQMLSTDFKFVFFASFMSREEAIGLDLMEGLLMLQEKMGGPKMFELRLRLSKDPKQTEKPPRWTEKWVKKELSTIGEVRAIWVCGPPVMNQEFEETLRSYCEESKMDFRTQTEIM
jgi:hypothetical protein